MNGGVERPQGPDRSIKALLERNRERLELESAAAGTRKAVEQKLSDTPPGRLPPLYKPTFGNPSPPRQVVEERKSPPPPLVPAQPGSSKQSDRLMQKLFQIPGLEPPRSEQEITEISKLVNAPPKVKELSSANTSTYDAHVSAKEKQESEKKKAL